VSDRFAVSYERNHESGKQSIRGGAARDKQNGSIQNGDATQFRQRSVLECDWLVRDAR
jgi:hypothetical protein